MKQIIRLEKVTLNNSADLAEILSSDEPLAKANGSTLKKVTAEEFFEKTKDWQDSTNSESYVIIKDNSSIGLTSLSHMTQESASVGCWISSKEWHKGYATQSFELLLQIAKKRGIKCVVSTINKDNVASLRIWEKAGAVIDKSSEKAKAQINLF